MRLIVPGYFGVNQIKYLSKLAFTEEQSDADVMRNEYRYRPVGTSPAPSQPTTWTMSAKSWIWPVNTSPLRRSATLRGVAFGGLEPVERVEVTWDEGKTWCPLEFSGSEMGRYAWRTFEFRLDLLLTSIGWPAVLPTRLDANSLSGELRTPVVTATPAGVIMPYRWR